MAEGNVNPFLSLFNSPQASEAAKLDKESQLEQMSSVLTRIFLIKGSNSHTDNVKYSLIFEHEDEITLANYERILAERLQMKDPSQLLHISKCRGSSNRLYDKSNAVETTSLIYLGKCYLRLQLEYDKMVVWKRDILDVVRGKITAMASVVICSKHNQIALLSKDFTQSDFIQLLLSESSNIYWDFIREIATSQNQSSLGIIFNPLLNYIYSNSVDLKVKSSEFYQLIDILIFCSEIPSVASLIVQAPYWLPWLPNPRAPLTGKSFQTNTIMGRFLSPTTLSPSFMQASEYFRDVTFPLIDINSLMDPYRTYLELNTKKVHTVFSNLLRHGGDVKERVTIWFINCLQANKDRGKMVSIMQGPSMTTASDGFFINLSWVLLMLCAPFSTTKEDEFNSRLMSIDPFYCNVTGDMPHVDFSQETKLVFKDNTLIQSSTIQPTFPVKFMTHCFFLTHNCLSLGPMQTINNYKKISQIIARLPQPFYDGGQTDQERMLLIQYIAMRTHLLAPNFIDLCLKYHIGTGSWLVELVKQDCPVGFPSSVNVPPVLTCIPECLVSNFCDLIAFFVQHQNATLHESTGLQHQLITFSVIFMKSHLLSNPHLRGKIAQVLSHLIPSNERRSGLIDISDIQRVVFESHSFANQHLFTSLLTIFIDIEHTGDSMEFEDKFSYRMPIYDIIKFLWEIPSYQQNLITLSKEVEKLSSSAETPLFLRFVNMMLNDATLQLDEGLKNLSKIYKIQLLKESTDWEEMSREEKGDQEEQLQEAMMYARNRNALALGTVNTLELITSQITEPFVIKAVVDQVASMLNYFLKELVSSKSKEFAVKDRDKYNFNPKELIRSIITIYINLGKEERFCQAIPRDGRSFSMVLFDQALNVLKRIGESSSDICIGLINMKENVSRYNEQFHMEELAMEDVPEEFLDPLMNDIMNDPVMLPTSGNIMDRDVIMRHLLGEQNDPFSREPLSADMLIPQEELRQKIEKWKKTKQISS